MVSLCGDAFGEGPGVPLLFEPVVNDRLACGLAMLETVGGPVQSGLMESDLLVEPGDHGGDVGFPPLLGVDLALRRHHRFFSSRIAVPPPGAMIGGPLGVFPRLLGFCPSGFGLLQGSGPIRQADADDGLTGDSRLGVEQGGKARLLVGLKRLEAVPGKGGPVG